jgi:hypothetical protein
VKVIVHMHDLATFRQLRGPDPLPVHKTGETAMIPVRGVQVTVF